MMTIAGRPLGEDHAAALRDGFDMTRAETAVVMGLAAGLDLQSIARDRCVSYARSAYSCARRWRRPPPTVSRSWSRWFPRCSANGRRCRQLR
ncbi:hypothetical protein [Sphingomonas ginsenosidimutans]|jgi:hypothetical protein|uniref:hypothetical protein n=1 Tax=Sphingomonas ginsenosidimutans TaxID=862134 RepID=UPI0011430DD9|nr:hypothetical protein [Sphingomonas ginsenosidimutans]